MKAKAASLTRVALMLAALTVILPYRESGAQGLPRIGDTDWAGTIQQFAVSKDGRLAVAVNANGEAISVDISTGQGRVLLRRLPLAVEGVAISPQSNSAAISSGGEEIYVLPIGHPNPSPRIIKTELKSTEFLAFSPDGKALAAFTGEVAYIPIWDIATGLLVKRLEPCGGLAPALSFSEDGRELAAVCNGNVVRVWDLSTSAEIAHFNLGPDAWANWVQFRADGRQVVVATGGTNAICVFDVHSGKLLRALTSHASQVESFVVPSNGLILSASDDGTVRAWNIKTGELLRTFEIPDGMIAANGSVVLTEAEEPGVLGVWNARTGIKIKDIHIWNKEGAKSGMNSP